MLLLIDRGFDGGDFLAAAAATKAQFLVRLTSTRRPPVPRHLPDGSFLSVIGGVKVRIITAAVTVTCHDGTTYGGVYRLAATLLDHRAYPADALMRSPTSRCATPCSRAASCARGILPGSSRKHGRCWPSPLKGVKKDEIDTALGYFENNAPRMRYHWFRQCGLFVGSGLVEAGCKSVIGHRLKRAGMHWTVNGADAIAALR
jgi:hypothetical protein